MGRNSSSESSDCAICLETVPSKDAVQLCNDGHRFCVECSWQLVSVAVRDHLVPACPHEKEKKCGTVPQPMAERALNVWLDSGSTRAGAAAIARASSTPVQSMDQRKSELDGWGLQSKTITTYGQIGYTCDKIDEVYRSVVLAKQGAVPCVGKGCGAWYIPERPGLQHHPERVECTNLSCKADFCILCKQPYHYHTSCSQALRLTGWWMTFLETEHDALLVAAMKINEAKYAPLLKAHTTGRHKRDAAVLDAFARFNEVKEMEDWKAQNCRTCPHCSRVIQRLSGCDHMICGADADAGRVSQNGCGKRFNWASAAPYVASGALEHTAASSSGAAAGAGAAALQAETIRQQVTEMSMY